MTVPAGAVRELFDVPRDVAYFNVSSMGPLLRASAAAAQSALAVRAQPWRIADRDWFDPAEARRLAFAELVGASPDAIALIPSVSYGFATAAGLLSSSPEQEIVVMQDDFPSGANTWRRVAADRGLRLRAVCPEAGQSWGEALAAAITARTAIVSAAPVHWMDGAIVDLAMVSQAARDVGARLVVDGTQAVGVMPVELAQVRPDFLIVAGYKWLLGPYGLSYLYVDPAYHDRVALEENWIVRQGAEVFARLAEPQPAYRPGARRFDAGEQAAFELSAAATVALNQLSAWTPEAISSSLRAVTSAIAEGAQRVGYEALEPASRAPHILSLRAPSRLGLAQRLAQENIFTSQRGERLRISPHLHVDEEDTQRLVRSLGALRAS